MSVVEKGKTEGATVSLGGKPFAGARDKGSLIGPTVFTDVQDTIATYREGIFGPLAGFDPFLSEDDAVRKANDLTPGLGAAIFTQDITRAHALAKIIEKGSTEKKLFAFEF